jgi:tricorn protease
MHATRAYFLALVVLLVGLGNVLAGGPPGYYRQPAIYKDTIVFVSEGDLWKVSTRGGTAGRLTTHSGEEGLPAISPDGQTVAFTGQYEGPTEVYTMPLAGGAPQRRTFNGGNITFVGWTPDGKLLIGTDAYSTLPDTQLVTIEIDGKKSSSPRLVPLAQAADGCYDAAGKTLFFTRLPFQGSHTKRYQGGTAQNLWKFTDGTAEAVALSPDYKGTSKNPMVWQDRIYFVSDRDGTMNLWSMKPDGADPKQLTRHVGWDIMAPSLSEGKIVYQLGADLHVYDIVTNGDSTLNITLDGDLDQTREHWVAKPMEYLTSAHLSPNGDRAVLTSRGKTFVAPLKPGRFVEVTRTEGVRYRDARFLADGKSLLALSDESGEVEFWKLPANGVGQTEQLTKEAEVLRTDGMPSPDGKWVAHSDKNQRLYVLDVENKTSKEVEETKISAGYTDFAWSPDSKWLTYVDAADNLLRRIKLYSVADGKVTVLTTDRFESYSPTWSPDGKWLYFLSDRTLKSIVDSPWGSYAPEPFLDKKTKIYQLALSPELRSPFAAPTELDEEKKESKKDEPKKDEPKKDEPKKDEPKKDEPKKDESTKDEPKKDDAKKDEPKKDEPKKDDKKPEAKEPVQIELDGIQKRLFVVPVPAGNYSGLEANEKYLFWLTTPAGEKKASLQGVAIGNEKDPAEVKTICEGIKYFELSADGKKLLVHKDDSLYIIDAVAEATELAKKEVPLSDWALAVTPREEWRQMFVESWRLERDFFYDRNMHGVDWKAMLKKYQPLVDRVNSRAELADLMAQMVSELCALHIFVQPGETRKGADTIKPAYLGAVLNRDDARGGYVVSKIYATDPDDPDGLSPLARPGVNVKEGDVIELVNGVPTLSVVDLALLLRRKADKQILLRVKPAAGGKSREVIVTPLDRDAELDLRYSAWEYSRARIVDEQGKGDLAYVHLRAMSGEDYASWARDFYPAFARKGLIIDMRHNRGGNIDSWIIGRLLRKAWSYWNQRVGQDPAWNMQFAFRGHVVVLCDEFTASDGEAFSEGFKRLGLGKVIGTRTWGGEIWLSYDNTLVDKGIASAAENGVFGPESRWLIEGHGVDPDVVVDNLPHATFKGDDAQLKAAIEHLQKMIKEKPVEPPPVPKFPNKSLQGKR